MKLNTLEHALELAKEGFYVFPVRAGDKLPAFKDWQRLATREDFKIKSWWARKNYNIGVSTSKFKERDCLLVIDVDEKKGNSGSKELRKLKDSGFKFPPTRVHETPTGGKHIIYKTDFPVKQGTHVLGKGLDIRAKGGYIVGQGSVIGGKPYTLEHKFEVAKAPDWLIEKLTSVKLKSDYAALPKEAESSRDRAFDYLKTAPLSIEGDGGDEIAFRVACQLKDLGVSKDHALEYMTEYWNERCEPPWDIKELETKISNAYQYGKLPFGHDSPEAQFDPLESSSDLLSPIQELNKEFAFVTLGGGSQILWETTDADGTPKTDYLSVQAFHQKFASRTMQVDGGIKQVTHVWMKSSLRRSYDGVKFLPGIPCPDRFYNLWKGFSNIDPPKSLPKIANDSLKMLLDHLHENICDGDEKLTHWLTGWFAHLIQKPWEKPLVAVVFKGSKGVGKSALIERMGALVKSHFRVTSNIRYLLGNFNSHLENSLLFVLEEAFWSGDKKAEGILKDLITGSTFNVERKGREPYTAINRTRIVIIGNDDWVVPATHDERRFAVFGVGEKLKQNRNYFKKMREGMEAGGYYLLFNYLKEYDFKDVDVNFAPETKALLEQKLESLEPFYDFWHVCLHEEMIDIEGFDTDWPEEILCKDFRDAFKAYFSSRNIRSRFPDDRRIGRMLKTCLGGHSVRFKKRTDDGVKWVYRLPPVDQCRELWDKYIGNSGGTLH